MNGATLKQVMPYLEKNKYYSAESQRSQTSGSKYSSRSKKNSVANVEISGKFLKAKPALN